MQTNAETTGLARPDAVFRAMFEARKRVFVDLLAWDVPVLAGRYEVDQFDTPEARYLILTDAELRHRASVRLLRTDQAHILANLFADLCRGRVPSGETTREITRFCIEPTLCRADRLQVRNQLVTALVDHALASEIVTYTAVANLRWFRQIEQFGWSCEALGPPRKVGGETLVALSIAIEPNTPSALSRTGIYDPTSYRLAGSQGELV